jgi:hypothetical protein
VPISSPACVSWSVEAVNDCAVATSDAQAAASEIAQGMANGTLLR